MFLPNSSTYVVYVLPAAAKVIAEWFSFLLLCITALGFLIRSLAMLNRPALGSSLRRQGSMLNL